MIGPALQQAVPTQAVWLKGEPPVGTNRVLLAFGGVIRIANRVEVADTLSLWDIYSNGDTYGWNPNWQWAPMPALPEAP